MESLLYAQAQWILLKLIVTLSLVVSPENIKPEKKKKNHPQKIFEKF